MQKKVSIPIIILVISISFVTVNFVAQAENSKREIPIIGNSYKYNSICDINDLEKFMMSEVWATTMQITGGFYNDNPKVIDFFKSNELLSKLELTPQELFKKIETTNTLSPNYDPILSDVMFWMPLTLDVMEASPELIETFSVDEFSSQAEYENRLLIEINKCN